MRTEKRRWFLFAVILAVLAGFTAPAFAGSLEPVAPPGPTMKTLDQISPTWDQVLPASERFKLVMGGAAVLDKETGLVWEKSPDTGTYTWDWTGSEAGYFCNNKAVGGRKGWRLPAIQELASLVDTSVSGTPKLPSGHPFINVQSSFYWSATTDPYNATYAWGVLFSNGVVYDILRTSGYYVWCVRGGQGYDAQ